MSDPRNSFKNDRNDQDSSNDENLAEDPSHKVEDGNTAEPAAHNTKGKHAVEQEGNTDPQDEREPHLRPTSSIGATDKDSVVSGDHDDNRDDKIDESEKYSSEQPPEKPPERASARQIVHPENFDYPDGSPRQVITYALYRQTALRGGRNDRGRFEYKRNMINKHEWQSKLHKSTSIDEIHEPHTLKVDVHELQAGEPPESPISPVSPEDEDGTPLSIWRTSRDRPRNEAEFHDTYAREATAIEKAVRPNRRQPPPRPRSAPPLELPSSSFSDDSDETDEQAEGREDAKAEMQARKQAKEREWLKELWGRSLGSQPLRPPVLSDAEGILREHRVYLQDRELRESSRQKDRNYLDPLGTHFRTMAKAKRFENVDQVIDYAVEEWKKNQVVMYSVWAKEKSKMSRKTKDREERLGEELRDEWDKACLQYSNMLIERDVKIKKLQKTLKRLQTQYEDPNKVESSRSQVNAVEEAKTIPESKLSIFFSEATATSPISPSIVCSGGPGWVAPDAIDLVVPEGMTIASPISPIGSPQTPGREHHPWNIALSHEPESRFKINTTLEGPKPHIEESTASYPPDLAPDFEQPCHCRGCGCNPEAVLEADKNRKKIKELEKSNDELRVKLMDKLEKVSNRLQGSIDQEVDQLGIVQDILTARRIKIASIRRAIGMSEDYGPIEGLPVEVSPERLTPEILRSRSLTPDLLRRHLL